MLMSTLCAFDLCRRASSGFTISRVPPSTTNVRELDAPDHHSGVTTAQGFRCDNSRRQRRSSARHAPDGIGPTTDDYGRSEKTTDGPMSLLRPPPARIDPNQASKPSR